MESVSNRSPSLRVVMESGSKRCFALVTRAAVLPTLRLVVFARRRRRCACHGSERATETILQRVHLTNAEPLARLSCSSVAGQLPRLPEEIVFALPEARIVELHTHAAAGFSPRALPHTARIARTRPRRVIRGPQPRRGPPDFGGQGGMRRAPGTSPLALRHALRGAARQCCRRAGGQAPVRATLRSFS